MTRYKTRAVGLGARLFIASLLIGCSTSRVEVSRHAPLSVDNDESIVILARRDNVGPEPEKSFIGCLSKALADDDTRLSLYPEQQFVDELFPWFEPRTAPATPEDLSQLLSRQAVARKIKVTGVRYVLWVEGDTETVDKGGTLTCGVGPGGGGCLGFVWWDKDSSYEVVIWDLEQVKAVGAISTEVLGTSYLPAVIVPIPLIARTQNTACKGLAQQLEAVLVADGLQ